jgi:16S rRNA (guanine1207-N2)-methyltransferase
MEVRPHPQEQLLIDQLGELSATRMLCTSPGLAQFALAAARQMPQAAVWCHYLDLYQADQTRQSLAAPPANLAIGCAADLPPAEVDLVAFPFSAQGEAELTRDLLQAGHERLAMGGRLLASTNNPRDRWLQEQMTALFGKLTRRAASSGVVYEGRKHAPLKKLRNFAAEFVFRDRERLIRACSRPGVFSHRRIDPGARQLLNAMEVAAGSRVLDIGCGAGVLSLAAALRAPGVQVLAVDSSARAVECVARGATLNELNNISVVLNASGDYPGQGTYDLVLANPPYYAAFQIARLFALAGRAALRPGGQILMVTKAPDWYRENLPQWFEQVQVEPSKEYHVVRGVRPA